MKLETIYNDLVDIMNSDMDFMKATKLKNKLEQVIREETCYKTTSKTRVNAIKKVASKLDIRPALMGYGICDDFKCVTDSYHAIMIKEENMPLKLVTTDDELVNKVGKENVIYQTYPNFSSFINFDKTNYDVTTLDYDDIAQFYKLHKKNAKEELYEIENAKEELYEIDGKFYNITFIKNVIDVLGKDTKVYISKNDYKPMYIENEKGELGLVLPVKKY
jgi:hypothetical protein